MVLLFREIMIGIYLLMTKPIPIPIDGETVIWITLLQVFITAVLISGIVYLIRSFLE